MADKNSSPRKLLFFLFLLFIPTIRLCKSDSPQNIEVYFPPPSPPLPPPPPPSPPTISSSPPEISTLSPESSPVTTSNKKKIAAAVGATAASTLILTGLAFFVIQRMIVAKRKRKIDSPVAGDAGGGGGGGSAMALQSRSQFVRYQGEVKGFIVDENGLDVLYWRKLEKRNADNALRKEVLKKNTKIQEVPLLRERSSTSHLVDDQDGDGDADHGLRVSNHNPQRNGVVFREPEVLSSRSSSISGPPPESLPPTPSPPPTPPPPPIPPPPPPPPAKKALVPPPPVPKLRSVNAGAKPPTAPPAKGKSAAAAAESGGPVKMKALHWDKVNMGNSDHSMVWDKINSQSGSFRFDGDLMEALFGYVATNNNNKRPSDGGEESTANSKTPPRTFILETRKSQNTAIVLRSLNVTRKEIIDALMEGIGLSHDTLERLSRIAPTQEEQTLILEFSGDASRLADADSFLFHLLRAVPSAFARLDAMLFRSVSGPEIAQLRDSVRVLEKACGELRTRGLFVKLLEAVLKAGNRMNAGTSRGNAQAFDLSSLRKLSDVRSTDGKTTLLHFVVSEVVRSEGKRCATGRDGRSGPLMNRSPSMKEERDREYATLGLPIVGGLSSEFSNVKKAAGMDHEGFSSAIPALAKRATQIRRTIVAQSVKGGFAREMEGFLNSIDEELRLVAEEKERALEAVKKTTEYYQAGSSTTANNQPFQLFVVVRDFLTMVDLVCVEIARNMQRKRVPVNSNSNSISNNGISKISKFGNGKYVMPGKIAAPEKFSVRFPNLPANFMSGRSSSSDSDDDDE